MSGRRFTHYIAAGLAVVGVELLFGTALAADVSVTASVDRHTVAVGEVFALTVTVRGTTEVSPPLFPSIDGIRLLSSQVSSRITTGVSGFQAEVRHIYRLQALKAGEVEIPPLEFKAGGRSYSSQSISVEVVEAATPSPSPSGASGGEPAGKRLFLRAFADVSEAYVGQQTPVTLQLCWVGVRISSPRLPTFSKEGFREVVLSEPTQTFRSIDGSQCNVLELTRVYFPMIPGRLTIGPFRITCDLLVPRESSSRRPSSIDDFFSSDFDTLFGTYFRKPVEVTAKAVSIDVHPLPEEGRPTSFSGAVGDFSMLAEVKPVEVGVGDGVTLTMTVHGEGDLEAATAALLEESDDLRAFPPEVSYQVLPNTDRLHTQKTFKQLAVVQTADVTKIPSVEFAYFDPAAADYRTIGRGPFPLTVTGNQPGSQLGVEPSTPKSGVSILSRGLFGIKTEAGLFAGPSLDVGSSPLTLAMVLIVPALIVSASWAVSRRLERLRFDHAYARSAGARKRALDGLRGGSGTDPDTCSRAARALCGLVADKLDLSLGSVTTDSIADVLRDCGVSADLAGMVLETLHVCDRGRFSGRSTEHVEDSDVAATARELIKKLDRAIRNK